MCERPRSFLGFVAISNIMPKRQKNTGDANAYFSFTGISLDKETNETEAVNGIKEAGLELIVHDWNREITERKMEEDESPGRNSVPIRCRADL